MLYHAMLVPDSRGSIPTPGILLLEARQYCKEMGCLENLRVDVEAAATSDSVAALVKQMQAELRDLMLRRECLVRRIQNLRQVMCGLRMISSAPSPGRHGSTNKPFPANRAAGVCGRHLRYGVPHKKVRVNVELWRACRIALLEAEKPVSLEEICTRIARRGSFSFVNPARANPVLLRALKSMAEDGEVHLLESAPGWRWKRMTPLKEA